MPKKYTPEERVLAFWSKAKITANPELCWIWTAAKDSDGYGCMGWGERKIVSAHRIAYELVFSEIPNSLEILHACDNPSCVNPYHLSAGTHQQNIEDMRRKGREYHPRGEQNSRSKLNNKQVQDIRERLQFVSQQTLADEFGVHQSLISLIATGKTRREDVTS